MNGILLTGFTDVDNFPDAVVQSDSRLQKFGAFDRQQMQDDA